MTKNETIKNWIDQYSGQLLRRAVYLLSDRVEAEDIVQEVLSLLFRHMNLLKGKVSL
jgi:RNA polymerase sigma-70 factor (ECF subfamily)